MRLEILPSTRQDKRYKAVIHDDKTTKTFHFGLKGGNTYIDHHDKSKRENYIKRHKVNEDWSSINAGSLSRYILWGNSTNIETNIRDFKKRFRIL